MKVYFTSSLAVAIHGARDGTLCELCGKQRSVGKEGDRGRKSDTGMVNLGRWQNFVCRLGPQNSKLETVGDSWSMGVPD